MEVQANDSAKGISLVVDASISPIHVGLPSTDGWIDLKTYQGQAMEGIFHLLHLLFTESQRDLNTVKTIYFCEGPGSTLGLRLAAAFVKTLLWESEGETKLFQYNSLDLAARMIAPPPSSLQAPFRLGRRFVRLPDPDGGAIGKKIILDEEDALKKFPESVHLPSPRRTNFPPPENSILEYDLKRISGCADLEPISVNKKIPVPYSPEPAVFKKWKPSLRQD